MSTDTATQRLWTTPYTLLCLANLGYFTAIGMQIPTLPRYVTGPLGATPAMVGATALTFAVAAVVARVPMLRRTPSRTLLTGGCLLLVPALLVLTVPALPAVFASRVLVGISDAMFVTMATTRVFDVARPQRHGSAMSYFTVTILVGLLIGPAAGETVRVGLGFTAVWIIAAALAVLATALTLAIPVNPTPRSAPTSRALPAGLLLPALLVVAGTLGPDGYALFVPLYADSLGQREATVDFLVLAGTTLVVRTVAARWFDRHPPARVALHSFAMSTAGLVVIALAASPAGLLAGTVLLGIGQAFCYPALVNLAVRRAGDGNRTAVVAVITACHDLTFGLAGLVLGGVVDLAGFTPAFLVAAAAAAAGFLATRRTR